MVLTLSGAARFLDRAAVCWSIEMPDALSKRSASSPGCVHPASPLTHLIEIGELESALVEALAPERDIVNELIDTLRGVTVAAARGWLHADTCAA